MFKNFRPLMFSFLALSSSLFAGDISSTQNGMCLIKQTQMIYPNLADSHFTEGSPSYIGFEGNLLSIRYADNVRFIFALPEGQIIEPGVYKDLMNSDCYCKKARLLLNGLTSLSFSRTVSDLEILEIQSNEKREIVSFAADFQIYDYASSEIILKGTIRFNSLIPMDEYYIKMMDQKINFQSTNLLYVKQLASESSEPKELIANDRRPLYVSLKENNGIELIISNVPANANFPNEEIVLHFPSLSDLFGTASFIIPNKSQRDDYTNPYDFWNTQAFPSTRSLSLKTKKTHPDIKAKDGIVTISEFQFDFRNNKVVSLAMDFSILGDNENAYEGSVRYNSNAPIPSK